MVRHWHAVSESSAEESVELNGDNRYFVVVEGYIVPKNENQGYDFYLINQTTGDEEQISNNGKNLYDVDTVNGTIKIPVDIIKDKDNNPEEHFSGFSISAGHNAVDAVTENNTEYLKISYELDVHLVKAHIFYSDEKVTVYGSGEDEGVFGVSAESKNKEQDTAWVYTYNTDNGDHKAGDVVTTTDEKTPVFYGENLPDGIDESIVQKTKVYNTIEGLHTDKTASAVDGDNRKFNIDLESWYSGAPLANIGFVLDSSGSMGFTSDNLTPININNINLSNEDKQKLEQKELKASNYSEGRTN